jgi:hypothetical protein
MIRTLLTCLLALAASTQVQAHGSHAAAGNSASHLAEDEGLLPDGKSLLVQDTTKTDSHQRAQIIIARSLVRTRPQQVEAPATSEAASAAEAPDFNPETAGLPAELAITLRRPEAPLGRRTYRTRLVRTGRFATHAEAVEILTSTYAGPLVLAQLPATDAAPAQVLAGPGYDATVALRPLPLTQEAVLHLCGERAPQVQAYARLYNLHFQQADEVARLLDYYNRIATVK